ncbi:MAG TPA: DUF488 domain-containing protein [Candidatus Binatia bacterium]|nr:DUF488 domain-containing protein [Candidatus Binatia bacterium]
MILYTIGHSNHSLDEFLALVEAHGIQCLVDVRAFPSSRRWPHFNREALAAVLDACAVRYDWCPALGGRRRTSKGARSPHVAWTVAAFRNYADYMDTAEFVRGLSHLVGLAAQSRTAFMCAEALYWQCHRRLIADRLVVEKHRVLHIQTRDRCVEHRLPDFARIEDGRLMYDRGAQLELVREG